MTQNEASVSVRALTRIEHDRQTHEPDTDTAVFPMPLKLAEKMRDMGVVAIITAEVDTAALLGAALTEAGATVVDSTTSDTEQGVTFADAVQQLDREAALQAQVAELQAQVLTLTNQVESLGGELAAAHEDLAELRNTAATDTVSQTGGDSLAGGDAPGNDTLAGGGDLTAGNDSVAAGGDSATSNDAVAAGTKSKSTKAKA
jgi:hypothetical protein